MTLNSCIACNQKFRFNSRPWNSEFKMHLSMNQLALTRAPRRMCHGSVPVRGVIFSQHGKSLSQVSFQLKVYDV